MLTGTAHLESVPLSLVVPIVRVAEGLGTTADFTAIEQAAELVGRPVVAAWLAKVEAVVAERVGRVPPPPGQFQGAS